MSVTRAVADRLANYSNPNSLGSRLRAKRIAPLLELIEVAYKKNGFVNIIDIGGTAEYWNIIQRHYLERHHVTITLVNTSATLVGTNKNPFVFINSDGCNLACFSNKSFHIAHSNSVIEHVGDWARMVAFSEELARVSDAYFVQTPNYWFPIEPHYMMAFIHWLPKPFRIWLVLHFQLGTMRRATSVDEAVRIVESARLLNFKMFQALFKDAQIFTERVFWLPKSFIALKQFGIPIQLVSNIDLTSGDQG